jgi:hypothetical protein
MANNPEKASSAGEARLDLSALESLTIEQAQVQGVFERCRPQTMKCIDPSCLKTIVVVAFQ